MYFADGTLYLFCMCSTGAAILALYCMRETRDVNLHDLDLAEPDLAFAAKIAEG
jgi:hypothetical protein